VSKAQYDKIWSYIESGKVQGAKLVLGGQKRPGKGYFVDPTSERCSFQPVPVTAYAVLVFTEITHDMKIVRSFHSNS